MKETGGRKEQEKGGEEKRKGLRGGNQPTLEEKFRPHRLKLPLPSMSLHFPPERSGTCSPFRFPVQQFTGNTGPRALLYMKIDRNVNASPAGGSRRRGRRGNMGGGAISRMARGT